MNIKNSIQTERGAEILLIFVLVARSTSFDVEGHNERDESV